MALDEVLHGAVESGWFDACAIPDDPDWAGATCSWRWPRGWSGARGVRLARWPLALDLAQRYLCWVIFATVLTAAI